MNATHSLLMRHGPIGEERGEESERQPGEVRDGGMEVEINRSGRAWEDG